MDVFDAIKTRRSIRKYKPDPVSDADMQQILEAAQWAPSWGNTQCWRFILIRDADLKAKVSGTLYKVRFEDGWLDNAAVGAILQAPVLVVVCAQKGLAGFSPDGNPVTDREDWLLFDIALSVQNLTLAARALGLGTVIIGDFDNRKAAAILDVPEDYTVVTMTPLGYPDHTGQAPPRKGLTDIIYKDRFGQP